MGIPENIDALLVKYDINQDCLARIADVAPSAITRWRQGAWPRKKAIERICAHFDLEEDDLLSASYGLAAQEHGFVPELPPNAIIPPTPRKAYAPLLGRVHAGDAQPPEIIEDNISMPYEIWDRHRGGYFLQVEGRCMSKVYPEGCYIFVDIDAEPQNGSIAVVSIDGADYVMRRLYRGANTMILSPDSWDDDYEDIVISGNDDHSVEFKGVVVWFQASKEME